MAQPDKSRVKLKSDIIRLCTVLAFFAALAWLLGNQAVRDKLFNIEQTRKWLQDFGFYGGMVFVGLSALATGFGIPRLWVSAFAGALYGAFIGAILGHVGSMLGATINFFTARWLLRGPIKRRMPDRMKKWYERFNQNGFRWLLYMRLFPLSNATVTNLVGGVSGMKYRSFLGATILGYTPLTIVFAVFGSSAAKKSWWQFFIGALILVIVIVSQMLYRKYNPPPEGEEESV
ncbi:MAG: TVP38/TMEM64 family protein [bacterium]|nr:TVP38/TMEM64 family protein [Candidatus Sumerlaeota bacterium]